MRTADKDVLDLLDHAWERLWNRMAGLTDREWSWRPDDADDKITIRWRLFHIAEVLTQSRNWTWLAVTPPEAKIDRGGADCAQDALASMDLAYAAFRELVTFESVDLAAAIGPAAGPYGSATRRTYVLRIADERCGKLRVRFFIGRRVSQSASNSRIAHLTHGIHQIRVKSCASPKARRPTLWPAEIGRYLAQRPERTCAHSSTGPVLPLGDLPSLQVNTPFCRIGRRSD